MERKKLSAEEIQTSLAGMEDWKAENNNLSKRFKFENFAGALAFVNRIGEIAERLDHHPDVTFGWGYAEILTTTHDRGGITDFDFALAKEIENLGKI